MVWIGAVMCAGPELAFVASPVRLLVTAGRGAHHGSFSAVSQALVDEAVGWPDLLEKVSAPTQFVR
jgi:hypothetical protein